MKTVLQTWPKFIVGFILCFGVRLLPFRPPNIEPLLATTMPFGKHMGGVAGFSFGFFSILLFDMLTAKVGMWTLITAIAYGLLGFGSYVYFRHGHRTGAKYYAIYAVVGTILYDVITGLSVGPLFFGQPFMEALTGQIPFTIRHVISNLILAVVVSPFIEKWIADNKSLDWSVIMKNATV